MHDELIAARIDRLPSSSLHRRLMILFSIPLFFDSVDINSFPSAAPALIHSWGMSINEIALITSGSFIGMFAGAVVGGTLADRIGRKPGLILFVIIASLGSLLTALAPNPGWLLGLRIVTGLGIAAGMVTVMTYISELFPAQSRGTWLSGAMVINLSAIPITNFVARLVVPLGNEGWRWVFVWGAVGLLFLALAPMVPESPRWLARVGRREQADATLRKIEARVAAERGALPEPHVARGASTQRAPWTTMFERRYLGRTLTLCAIWMLQTLGFYGFEAWVPTLLVKHGITLVHSLTYFTLINVGAPLGALLAVYLSDRFERRNTIAVTAAAIAVFGLLYGLTFEPAMIVGFGFLVGMLVQTFASLLYSYTPEQFPTDLRNGATGVAYGVGRIANVLNAFVVAAIFTNLGYVSVFVYIAGAWVLTALITIVFGTRTTRQSLEVLNPIATERSFVPNPPISAD